jgi:hypothetical protein
MGGVRTYNTNNCVFLRAYLTVDFIKGSKYFAEDSSLAGCYAMPSGR